MQPVVQVEMSRQVKLVADKSIQDAAHDSYDAIALPVWSLGASSVATSQHINHGNGHQT